MRTVHQINLALGLIFLGWIFCASSSLAVLVSMFAGSVFFYQLKPDGVDA